jgi:hypothetical protein
MVRSVACSGEGRHLAIEGGTTRLPTLLTPCVHPLPCCFMSRDGEDRGPWCMVTSPCMVKADDHLCTIHPSFLHHNSSLRSACCVCSKRAVACVICVARRDGSSPRGRDPEGL